MQPEKDQVMLFSNDELQLIKNTFAENDELLYAIRNVLLQFPLSDAQKQMVRTMGDAVYNVVKKRLLPDLSPNLPLGQLASILTTLTNDVRTKTPEETEHILESRKVALDYLNQQFSILKDLDVAPSIKLSDLGSLEGENAHGNIETYLFLLGYIDPGLIFIKSLAGTKEETLEEQKIRLTRDSSK